ncbi:hypothetical protein ACOMHN_011098 [Nucella lapillus]
MADFLMGVYIVIIGIADEQFRGTYLHHDNTWKSSVMCKVAGVLSLLSSEVSALIIWIITLDRFVALHFPFSTLRFGRVSAAVACLLIWKDMTIASRLITVAVTDFMCWFPIGTCGLLALAGSPVPGEVNVALAIFVLPLNSAINPFMYTFNTLMEKRRKSNEAELLKLLESHADMIIM